MIVAVDVRSLMEGRRSGVEVYTTELLRALVRLYPEHTWRLFYNSWRPVELPSFGGNVEVCGWRYPNKLLNVSQLAGRWPRWDQLVAADVFFVPNMRLVPLAPATPLVVTAHDLSFARFPEFYSIKRRVWHRVMQPRRLMERATRVIAVSQATAADVTTLYDVPAERVRVVYSGVHVTHPARSAAAVRAKYNLPAPYILFLGTQEPRKNVVSIMRAFSEVADRIPQDLVIAGLPGWLMRDIRRTQQSVAASHRIHFVGAVPEQNKPALYEMADLFVYPSFYEGFGFPPLESLLVGTPVVVSRNSALAEVVGEWATLIDPYQPGELAVVLRELLAEGPPPRVPLAARQAVAARYSWERAARETLAVLEEAAGVPALSTRAVA